MHPQPSPRALSRFDLAALLNRAAAAIETPKDLTAEEIRHVVEDLNAEADKLDPAEPSPRAGQAHTPGPWHVEPCIWGGYPFRISGPGDSAGSAGMFSPCLIMGDGTHNAGTAQANARLIAAAPELLAYVAKLAGVGKYSHANMPPAMLTELVEEARALLARLEAQA